MNMSKDQGSDTGCARSVQTISRLNCIEISRTAAAQDVAGKLQGLVYDILPSTTAVFSYAIGSRKLSANEQFFVGAQTVVSLLQTSQIISDVYFTVY